MASAPPPRRQSLQSPALQSLRMDFASPIVAAVRLRGLRRGLHAPSRVLHRDAVSWCLKGPTLNPLLGESAASRVLNGVRHAETRSGCRTLHDYVVRRSFRRSTQRDASSPTSSGSTIGNTRTSRAASTIRHRAIEINLSCPRVRKASSRFGNYPEDGRQKCRMVLPAHTRAPHPSCRRTRRISGRTPRCSKRAQTRLSHQHHHGPWRGRATRRPVIVTSMWSRAGDQPIALLTVFQFSTS